MVTHPNWGLQQPGKPTFAGKVLILINRVSFPTTSEFLSQAHYHKRATFLGEESGGTYYGNSSGPQLLVTLPKRNVRPSVPLMTYTMTVKGYQDVARGFRLDPFLCIPQAIHQRTLPLLYSTRPGPIHHQTAGSDGQTRWRCPACA